MNSPKYHSLETIMANARTHGGNKTPEPELITVEVEREKICLPGYTLDASGAIAKMKTK